MDQADLTRLERMIDSEVKSRFLAGTGRRVALLQPGDDPDELLVRVFVAVTDGSQDPQRSLQEWARAHETGMKRMRRELSLRLPEASLLEFTVDQEGDPEGAPRITMPDDPALHTATMLYCSDTTVLDSIITTHGLSWGFDRIFAATVNHSVWFHRQVSFDDWVLYSTSSPVATDSRGLGTGYFFDRSGRPVATVVQEGVVKYFPGSRR